MSIPARESEKISLRTVKPTGGTNSQRVGLHRLSEASNQQSTVPNVIQFLLAQRNDPAVQYARFEREGEVVDPRFQ